MPHLLTRGIPTMGSGLSTPPITPPADGSMSPIPVPWQEIAVQKQAQREEILQRYSKWRLPEHRDRGHNHTFFAAKFDDTDVSELPLSLLTPREREIVHHDATKLSELLRERKLSSVEVTTAFCKVATVAQDLTNCLTEIFFDEALRRAKELDDHLEKTGEVVGPLHGLPVSIKDHILIKGYDTSTGYIAWAGKRIAEKDAVVVDIFRKAGAVLYAKTANPQTLMSLETNNNVYGRTLNPFNRTLSPGGSSGGESALIACRGSPLGVGTDIGGSIRAPAAFCGLYGLKGSVGRMPHAGLLGSHDGMDAIVGVLGPLAQSARDLSLFCRVMLSYEAWLLEHAIYEMPWKEDVANGSTLPAKLSFGILSDDGVVAPHPPIRAALKKTKEALLAAGHEVVEWRPLEHKESWDLLCKLYFLDGGAEYYETMAESGEPPVPGSQWILSQAPKKAYTIDQVFKLNLEREAFRSKALAHWNASKIRTTTGRPVDAILCPCAPTLAPLHDGVRWWGYTSYWNLLDYPGVVFPCGKFSAFDENASWRKEPIPVPRNDVEKSVWNQWNPEAYDHAPISLQLIGRRHNEEKLLAILNVLERATGVQRD